MESLLGLSLAWPKRNKFLENESFSSVMTTSGGSRRNVRFLLYVEDGHLCYPIFSSDRGQQSVMILCWCLESSHTISVQFALPLNKENRRDCIRDCDGCRSSG
jgi:hypothetical protein